MPSSFNGSDFHRILQEPHENYFPPDFKEYMLKEQLKGSRQENPYPSDSSFIGWVVWSDQDHEIETSLSPDNYCADFNPNVCAIPKVRDNIRRALQKLILLSKDLHDACLVQFWAATTTLEGRTKLTTQYQPFALAPTVYYDDRQQLCEYRMKMCSSEYNNFFYADAESGEEQLGLPGRVFLYKSPELTPDVEYYSTKEYPQRDLAIRCGIKESWALPVFEHSSETCVGVLEFVSLLDEAEVWYDQPVLTHVHDSFQGMNPQNWSHLSILVLAPRTMNPLFSTMPVFDSLVSLMLVSLGTQPFKEFGLICYDYSCCEMRCRGDSSKREDALEELSMVLSSVCEIHELPLALIWFRCNACSDLLQCQLMSEDPEYAEDSDKENVIAQFSYASKFTHLRKRGVFERALSSPCMLYYPDITQFSIAEYPLVHYARRCKLSGLFTICLQSGYTEKEVYIVEFFFPTSNNDDENILTTLSLILGTMEKNFETFKLASGQRLGEISSAEVMGFRDGQKLPFVQMIQAPRLSPSPELIKERGLMLQLGQLDRPSTDAIRNGMNDVSEELLSSLEALQDEEAMMQLDSTHQPPLDSSNNGHDVVTAEENITVVTSLQKGKRKTRENKGTGVRIEVSLEDLLKCEKMKRKDAAKELNVSESTLKRACREHGIHRWPPRNMQNVSPSRPSPVKNQGQTLQLNSGQPSNQAVPGVAHMKPGVQDANRVTFRAKYKNKTIKFHLSFSSRLVEFQQEVAKRLHLVAGTYYAEYKDEEGELICIACDDDLLHCMHTSRSPGNTSIEVLLKLEEPL